MITSKVYLNVPYAEKDAAKTLGAKWDAAKKKWYAPAGTEISSFSKWHDEPNTLTTQKIKAQPNSLGNKSLLGVIRKAKDKNFVAYSGELPPWD